MNSLVVFLAALTVDGRPLTGPPDLVLMKLPVVSFEFSPFSIGPPLRIALSIVFESQKVKLTKSTDNLFKYVSAIINPKFELFFKSLYW